MKKLIFLKLFSQPFGTFLAAEHIYVGQTFDICRVYLSEATKLHAAPMSNASDGVRTRYLAVYYGCYSCVAVSDCTAPSLHGHSIGTVIPCRFCLIVLPPCEIKAFYAVRVLYARCIFRL